MLASAALLAGLVDDAAMFPPGNASPADSVAGHRDYRQAWFAAMIGPLVVSDRQLAETARTHADQAPLPVSVVNTSGAGGLVALAARSVPELEIVAVESALRDLDDLAGNAARVTSAAAELDESVRVFVEIPYAPGWERAVAEVEAAGLLGKIRTGGLEPVDVPTYAQLARQLSVLIEADLSFKATAGLHHAVVSPGTADRPHQHGLLNLLVTVEALVEGATETEAAALLARTDAAALVATVGGWPEATGTRVRRRLRSFGCCGVRDPIDDLVAVGLLSPAP